MAYTHAIVVEVDADGPRLQVGEEVESGLHRIGRLDERDPTLVKLFAVDAPDVAAKLGAAARAHLVLRHAAPWHECGERAGNARRHIALSPLQQECAVVCLIEDQMASERGGLRGSRRLRPRVGGGGLLRRSHLRLGAREGAWRRDHDGTASLAERDPALHRTRGGKLRLLLALRGGEVGEELGQEAEDVLGLRGAHGVGRRREDFFQQHAPLREVGCLGAAGRRRHRVYVTHEGRALGGGGVRCHSRTFGKPREN
mmetsp:Transcript_43200/g.119495  ORF Transcript_43200/g.119495 Transcript_43200/m.119495 type:complete len:256 (-) Transcript_43200:9-776(-)